MNMINLQENIGLDKNIKIKNGILIQTLVIVILVIIIKLPHNNNLNNILINLNKLNKNKNNNKYLINNKIKLQIHLWIYLEEIVNNHNNK